MDRKKDRDEQAYLEYLEDIEIARKEIQGIKLYPTESIVCDLYAIPSHNHQAYYAIIYEHAGKYEMVYAKSQIYTPGDSEPIKMYRFADCKEADKRTGTEGRILIGIAHLPKVFMDMLVEILDRIPSWHIQGAGGIWLDGVTQAIRVYHGDDVVKEVVYKEAEQIPLSGGGKDLIEQLDNLYLRVEEIIDCVDT